VKCQLSSIIRGVVLKTPGIFAVILLARIALQIAEPFGFASEAGRKVAGIQIPFVLNLGQSSKEVKFAARMFAGEVAVTETGRLVYSLSKLAGETQGQGVMLTEELVGGKVKQVKGESRTATKVSYFTANDRSKWRNNLPSFERVTLGEVYKGVEVKLRATGNNVEKVFHVKPGAKPETIRVRLSGGKGVRVDESGQLEVETEQGTVSFSKPLAFQERSGRKESVEVAYLVRDNEYWFKVGDYDRTRELIVDPILAATYVGGGSGVHVRTLALDPRGNVYVAGNTSPFPNRDGYVVKLNSDLSSILAVAFVGGSGYDFIYSLVLDGNGNVCLAGITGSADFPGIGPGSADTTFEGTGHETEGFTIKLDPNLSSIQAATFIGGNSWEYLTALATDNTGNIYVAGNTSSSDFPGLGPGSADSTIDGDGDGFVAKLNSDLSAILAATLFGGTGAAIEERISSLALDSTGSVFVAGLTDSPDLPGVGPGSADSIYANSEGFVIKLNSDLSAISAATFLGGSDSEFSDYAEPRLALDSAGNVYVAGTTSSSDLPGISPASADGTFDDSLGSEGFVAKLDSDLRFILAATYLGSGVPLALIVDSMGSAYVAGGTWSSGFFSIDPGSADSTFFKENVGNGLGEGFVAKLDSDLRSLLAATYLGGFQDDQATAIIIDNTGHVFVAGSTGSFDFPGIGPDSANGTFPEDSWQGFVAKLDAGLSSGLQLINDSVNLVVQSTSLNSNTDLEECELLGCPGGIYTITARLTNKSQQNIQEPVKAVVRTLTNGNRLLSATEGHGGFLDVPTGNGGVGSMQTIDAGTDDVLLPSESVSVRFRIALASRDRFSFFVDIWGAADGTGH
jgi:hypothetical protein